MGEEPIGAFSFVLHSHLPYCRRAGRWPHGEEWLHEAASETYLPLLDVLRGLQGRGVPFNLTIGITPILAEQLADGTVRANLRDFMEEKHARAAEDVQRFAHAGDDRRLAAARWYRGRYERLLALYEELGGSVLSGFKALQDAGLLEIATSAATHGYMPLMERDSTISAQFAVGAQSYRRHFGREPRSCWLPECAYRPSFMAELGGQRYVKPGVQTFMAENGLNLFFVETHTLEGGAPVGKAQGDAVGPYGSIPRRYVVPLPDYPPPRDRTTFLPYWVETPDVAVLGRNSRTGLQVWSASHGYPGDFDYREFHKRDGVSGLHYWRVTGAGVDLGEKDRWDPAVAFDRTNSHADHFAGLVEDELNGYRARAGGPGIIAAAYDTELFGHWWFEGIEWLGKVLERLSRRPGIALSSAGGWVAAHPAEEVLALPESSWGQAGNHFTWLNADTEWMWPIIHAGERRMERLVEQHPAAEGGLAIVLNQCARELLLLESSDWPFLVTTGQAREYAIERFESHVDRFNRLAAFADSGEPGPAGCTLAEELWELDKVFPMIDYRLFRSREPAAG
ncbi:MAG TPA: 1,4-alpha-glucan branching protein domain-containing protein [Dehalococcoidia bacterium]|nr:1,4-alpha-glucan branching protein domain-containing protein [Dehalococcoidia bacterium]